MNWFKRLFSYERCHYCRWPSRFQPVIADRDPTNKDDNYPLGNYWINSDKNELWVLVKSTVNDDAVWINVSMAYKGNK